MTVAAGTVMAPRASAQHVVTDDEAGKLTFDALTATPRPIVHRVIYRTTRSYWAEPIRQRSIRGVRAISYRHSIREGGTMTHLGYSRHRRG